jgi:hypothetical protein
VLLIASPEAREWLHIPGKRIGRQWQPAPPPPAPLTPADPHHRTGVRNRNVFPSSKEFDFSPGYAQQFQIFFADSGASLSILPPTGPHLVVANGKTIPRGDAAVLTLNSIFLLQPLLPFCLAWIS